MKMTTYQAFKFFHEVFMTAGQIVSGRKSYYTRDEDGLKLHGYTGRKWFAREWNAHQLHPAIEHVIVKLGNRPRDWHQLLLEWPHRSVTDYNRLAYTRDERAGIDDRQTVTTLGKYLMRHFDMPDHEIRDTVALHTSAGQIRFINDMDGILNALKRGPTSCMTADIEIRCLDGELRHPYEVYDPSLGWRMAVRLNGTSIDGRALVYCCPTTGDKMFVRSYKRDHGGGYSYADESLEAWLKDQGATKIDSWCDVDAQMAYYPARGEFLMPYLDGCNHNVDVLTCGDSEQYVVAAEYGEHSCDNTNGFAGTCGEVCEDCGERHGEDDMYWVEVTEDRHVCHHCIDNYRYAYSRRGNQYYIHDDNCVYVDSCDEWYDLDYLSDNHIVELVSGGYEHIDLAVEVDGDWYYSDDSDITWDEYNERHALVSECVDTEDLGMVHKNDAWQCSHSSNWYSNNIEPAVFECEYYHPDHVPTEDSNA